MNKNEFHGNAKHSPTISEQITDLIDYGTKAKVIDAFDRVWEASRKHSGVWLNGLNHEGHIPYWTCYKLNLPKLRFFEDSNLPEAIKEPMTLEQIMNPYGDCDGYRFIDNANIVWGVKKCHYMPGYEIHDMYDNGWLPWKTCGVISIPGFRLIQTKNQVDEVARKWKKVEGAR